MTTDHIQQFVSDIIMSHFKKGHLNFYMTELKKHCKAKNWNCTFAVCTYPSILLWTGLSLMNRCHGFSRCSWSFLTIFPAINRQTHKTWTIYACNMFKMWHTRHLKRILCSFISHSYHLGSTPWTGPTIHFFFYLMSQLLENQLLLCWKPSQLFAGCKTRRLWELLWYDLSSIRSQLNSASLHHLLIDRLIYNTKTF